MNFSKRLKIEPSTTGVMNDLATQKKNKGEKVYNLSAGEPMIDTSKIIVQAALQTMSDGKTHYSPVSGIEELKKASIKWMANFYSANYYENQVLITCGGKFVVFAALQCLLDTDDEVVVVGPHWVSYKPMVNLAGGVVKMLDTNEEDDWDINIKDLKFLINNKTKAIILNNASNPTGALYSKKRLKQVLQLASENNLTVISDEVYSGLVYDGDYISAGSFKEYQDNVLVVQSCSKNFAMTGWRVGFAFGHEELIKKIAILQSQSITNTSTISQWAAISALENADKISQDINKEMKKRRDVFVNKFNELFDCNIQAPPSSLYCFVSLDHFGIKETNSTKFCKDVLTNADIAIVPGVAFGKEGYVRFSFGAEENELIEALGVLKKYLLE